MNINKTKVIATVICVAIGFAGIRWNINQSSKIANAFFGNKSDFDLNIVECPIEFNQSEYKIPLESNNPSRVLKIRTTGGDAHFVDKAWVESAEGKVGDIKLHDYVLEQAAYIKLAPETDDYLLLVQTDPGLNKTSYKALTLIRNSDLKTFSVDLKISYIDKPKSY